MDFQVWYNELPFVTKHYMTIAFITTAITSFGLITAKSLYLDVGTVFYDFEIWRLFTNFLYFGKFSFDFLFRMILLYFGLSKLEKLYTPNKYAELFYLVVVNSFLLLIIGLVFQSPFLSYSLSFCFLYIWCKRVPFERVQFLFGFLVTSAYLPWVLIGYTVITGGSVVSELLGLASGHLYIILKDIVPNSHGYNFLRTPQFVEKLVNKYFYQRNLHVRPGENMPAGPAAGGFQNFGGGGVRIG